MEIKELLALICQGSAHISSGAFSDLAKLLTEELFESGTECKGNSTP